jgi:hypothetical protein
LELPATGVPAVVPAAIPGEIPDAAVRWPGIAGEAPLEDLSEFPAPVELPERFEDLAFPVTTPAN